MTDLRGGQNGGFWFKNFHTTTKLTPFEALYGFPCPRLVDYIPGNNLEVVDSYLKNRE